MLEGLDLKKKLAKPLYSKRMTELQEQLRGLQYSANQAGVAVIICLEGWDMSGRGHVIKKLMERLDPRLFRVYPGTEPTPLEQRYHFLWRYQTRLPNRGEMALFDHSWYGRVLVERCDKLTKKKDWKEAYGQINEFERWLADDRQVIVKLFLHISKKEQKKRFREALADPALRWKITKEYKRHHKQYSRWEKAIEEMLAKTSTPYAPWTPIEANDLRWARVRVFETLIARLEAELAARGVAVGRKAAVAAKAAEKKAAQKASQKAEPATKKDGAKREVAAEAAMVNA